MEVSPILIFVCACHGLGGSSRFVSFFFESFSIGQWKYLNDEATDYAYCHNAHIQATPPLILGCVAVVQQLARVHLGFFGGAREAPKM